MMIFFHAYLLSFTTGHVIVVTLSSGKKLQLKVRSDASKTCMTKSVPDHVKNYGHIVLELGLLFKDLLDVIHLPDRDRCLRLLKLAMIFFKANKNLSKYAHEILRFLVHQTCTLSETEAHEVFYGLFVNTRGKKDSHIPADLQVEHLVRTTKKHIN